MWIFQTAIALVIGLGVLVIAHEWGHFIAARMCGIRVDEFSIGFGPRAWRIGKLGDTEYNVRWIPLGGYVKIAGMEPDEEPLLRARDKVKEMAGGLKPEESEKEAQALSSMPLIAENMPNLAETDEQRRRDETEGFYAHPLWQRAWVIFAGPLMSFALGYVLFFGIMLAIGIPGKALNIVDRVQPGSEAERIGMKAGDQIVAINGRKTPDGDTMVGAIRSSGGKPVSLSIERAGVPVTITGIPHVTSVDGQKIAILGFSPRNSMDRASPGEAFLAANRLTVLWLQQVKELFLRHNLSEFRKSAGGPIFIVQATRQAVDAGGPSTPFLFAQLSMSLAIFNLLPIPILDGGHLLMFVIEGFRRGRRLSLEQQQNFMLAGLAVIGVLFVLIMFNDIMRKIHPLGP